MAIGGYSWNDDRYDDSGFDMNRGEKWFSVRVEFKENLVHSITSTEPVISVPNKLIEQKLALLKMSPVGAKIDSVGWRRKENVFYLRIYETDLPLGER
jgi:hypothetical protein